jgi:hypothetical protein
MFESLKTQLIEVPDHPRYKYKCTLFKGILLSHFQKLIELCHWFSTRQPPRHASVLVTPTFECPMKPRVTPTCPAATISSTPSKLQEARAIAVARAFTMAHAPRAVRKFLKCVSTLDLLPMLTASHVLGLLPCLRDALAIEAARRMDCDSKEVDADMLFHQSIQASGAISLPAFAAAAAAAATTSMGRRGKQGRSVCQAV